MMNNFQIKALAYNQFANLFLASDDDLKDIGALKMIVNEHPGFPCRVSLQDATIGEEVLLLPFKHHKTDSPYQSTGAIYIRKNAEESLLAVNEIPKMLLHRLVSLRCYNKDGMMIDASVVEGKTTKEALQELFTNKEIDYIHIHNAKPGCYNCLAERV